MKKVYSKIDFSIKADRLQAFVDLAIQNKIKWDGRQIENYEYSGFFKYSNDIQLAEFMHALGNNGVLISIK